VKQLAPNCIDSYSDRENSKNSSKKDLYINKVLLNSTPMSRYFVNKYTQVAGQVLDCCIQTTRL
jgi:hypothetical protein